MNQLIINLPDWLEVENVRPGINRAIVRKNIIFPKIANALGYELDSKKQAFGLTAQQVTAMKRALRQWLVEKMGCKLIKLTGKNKRDETAARDIKDPAKRKEALKNLRVNKEWAVKQPGLTNDNFREDVAQGEVIRMRDIYGVVRDLLNSELS